MKGLPAITEIPVASFAAWYIISALSQEYHIVHLEGFSPSRWRSNTWERESINAEGWKLTCQGITFLPTDVAVTLLNLEGNVAEFSRQLFPRLAS